MNIFGSSMWKVLPVALVVAALHAQADEQTEDDFSEFDSPDENDDESEVEVNSDPGNEFVNNMDEPPVHIKPESKTTAHEDEDEPDEANDETNDEFDPYTDDEEFE